MLVSIVNPLQHPLRNAKGQDWATAAHRVQQLKALWMPLCQHWIGGVQVAKQQGEYVAKLLASGKAKPGQPVTGFKGFRYGHKGSLAYVGRDKAVMDVPAIGPVFGYTAGADVLLPAQSLLT